MHLIKTELSIVVDAVSLINMMEKYRITFTKYNQLVPHHVHTAYFKTLPKCYEEIGGERKARRCHEEILRRGSNLKGCNPGECSNIEIAEANKHLGDYEASIRFYEMEYNLTSDEREKAQILIALYNIHSLKNDPDSMDQVSSKLAELVPSLIQSYQASSEIPDQIFTMLKC